MSLRVCLFSCLFVFLFISCLPVVITSVTHRVTSIGADDADNGVDVSLAMAAKLATRQRKEEQIRQDAQRMYELESKLMEVRLSFLFFSFLLLCQFPSFILCNIISF